MFKSIPWSQVFSRSAFLEGMFSLQDGERDSKAVHGTSNIENRKGDAELEAGLRGGGET